MLPAGGGPGSGFDPLVRVDGGSGQASLRVPLATTPARGRELGLALDYTSGGGNGPCGLGFTLALSSVDRMLARGVPRYDDSDTFVLAGVGELTPAVDPETGAPRHRVETVGATAWRVDTYRPVDEGQLPLAERWRVDDLEYWVVVTRENTVSVFGRSAAARTADPDDPSRVLQWLVEESVDAHGNVTAFEYKPEDGAGVRNEVYERDRVRTARRYPQRIRYGNDENDRFAFEVVFDYGEYDVDGEDPYTPVRPWSARIDPFSTYAGGFEIRTYRLCRGVLMFHRFPDELGDRPVLTAATRFGYREDPHGTLLTSVTTAGFRRGSDGDVERAETPTLELTYTGFAPPPVPEFAPMHVDGGYPLPGYLTAGGFWPVDLDGQGLPGLLRLASGRGAYYPPRGEGRYGAPTLLPLIPDADGVSTWDLSATDLDGDGGLQLLVLNGTAAGTLRRDREGWAPFRPLASVPTSLRAARGELADLNGDGRAELLFVGRDWLSYHPSLGTAGFGPSRVRPRPDGFPSQANNSEVELVTFAAAFGDGLTHRVRVRDGEVTVWPSLGHGRFAPPVRLAGSPRWPAGVTAADVHLTDIDGSGTLDLVLTRPTHLLVYRNRAGNGFDEPITVPLPFVLGPLDQVTSADVRGTGTTALVVSRMAGPVEHWYVDLCGGVRPNLLSTAANGLGGASAVEYSSSSRYLLADAAAGRAWLYRMPFSITVVAALTSTESVGRTAHRTVYDYHDGYFDPVDRQFQGFGLVETQSTEDGVSPVRTRTWYHTGDYTSSDATLEHARSQYWAGDPAAYRMPDCVLDPRALTAGGETARQAYRALRGRMLRTEVYGEGPVPLAVNEDSYVVRLIQPAGRHGRGSYAVQPRESMQYSYEGAAGDPRVRHTMLLACTLTDPDPGDTYHELTATVDYPRRVTAPDPLPEQRRLRVLVHRDTHSRVTGAFRRIGLTLQREVLELGGLPHPAGYFSFAALAAAVEAALADRIPYGQPFAGWAPQSRPAALERTLYWDADQTVALPAGRVAPGGLVHHTNEAAFPGSFVTEVFGDRVGEPELLAAGYVQDDDGYWWLPGPVTAYLGADGFHLPAAILGHPGGPYLRATADYDRYRLVQVSATEYVDDSTPLTQVAEADYQAAAVWSVTDANGVERQVRYDPLGRVLATSIRKGDSGDGDLRDYVVREATGVDAVLADPPHYLQRAATFHLYDHTAWPAVALSLVRPGFASDPAPERPVEVHLEYADGLGRLAQRRTLAEDGRWIATSASVQTMSELSIVDHLPFYGDGPGFGLTGAVAPQLSRYDALGRLVWRQTPKGFVIRAVHDAWERADYDEDDTVLESPFYLEFMATYPEDPTPAQRAEKDALDKAAAFAGTPTVVRFDVGGNAVRRIVDARAGGDPARPLISTADFDGLDRPVRAVDPRLRRHNEDTGENLTSEAYAYAMGTQNPVFTGSADAGGRWSLPDALGRVVREWDGRDIRTERAYDGLSRPVTTTVAGRLAEAFTYGEHQDDPASANLNGHLYLMRDQTGTVRYPAYAITGEPVESWRRYAADYTTEPDWSGDVPLDDTDYLSTMEHDALGRLVGRIAPDGTGLRLGYHVSGRLATVIGTDGTGAQTRYLTGAGYTAAGRRVRVGYGNGATQLAAVEETTGRVLGLTATRADGTEVQRVSYAYDPVGNLTRVSDDTPDRVFAGGQPEAVGDHAYDASYRLLRATGRQHPDIGADSYVDGFKQSAFADLSGGVVLEEYTERYEHDDAGNLVALDHLAGNTFRRTTPVVETSNRLAGAAYDGAGHPLSLALGETVGLAWDSRGRLANTSPVRRDDGTSERTWFTYDA